jgi:hypothetical protein
MQINKIAAACAVAFASTAAIAAPLTGYNDTPDYVVYLSGATAPDNFLDTIATALFVGAKGAQWYKFVDNVDGKQQRAYFGEMKPAASGTPASLANKKVLFIKRSTGGSVFGVNPVARGESLAVLQAANAACTSTGSGNYTCPIIGDDSGSHVDAKVPDFGVSDVAPTLFKAPFNVEFGKSELSTTEAAALVIKQVNLLAMGLAVTNTVPATTHISKAAYGALLSGNRTTWTGIGAAAPTTQNEAVVCRRVPGSGTQTSYNWYFNNFPCTTGSVAGNGETAPARMTASAGYNDADEDGVPDVGDGLTAATAYEISPTGYTVLENSTSGNVRDCMNKAANGGTHTFKDEQNRWFKVNFGTGGYGAIGVLSVDSLGDTSSDGTTGTSPGTGTTGFSFRAIDGAAAYWDGTVGAGVAAATTGTTGVLPTKANLLDAKYDFAVEVTMQYLDTLTGPKKDFADFFSAKAGDPANNTSMWVAALPPTFAPPTANVAKATHFGNMCAPLQLLY